MVGGDVEGLEVELVGLDLGALDDDEAELAEDARDLALRLADAVERAAPAGAAGQRDVLALGGEAPLEGDRSERVAALGERCLDRLADGVGERADPRPVLRRERADAAQQRAQLALAAEDSRLDRVERGRDRPPRWPRARAPRSASSWARNDARSTTGWRARRYWAFATSAMRANVAASRTAMSARTLRSRATPAALRPLMSLP